MNDRFLSTIILLISVTCLSFAQSSNILHKDNSSISGSVFSVENPNFQLSPFTGMTRNHWKEAGLYLLKGAFSYVHSINDPLKFTKQEGISYPRDKTQYATEKLEGLCRTLFIAAPLLKEDPNLEINGIKLAAYYRFQIASLIDPKSENYISRRSGNYCSQNLVEFGGLAISLFVAKDVLWTPLSQEKKDALALTMLSYGDGPTVDSNWKFFNIFIISFFKNEGYPVDEALLESYLNKTLTHYRGEGWYNDAPCFDYYSMWAFQMYGSIWSEYFGKKFYPEIAQKLADNFSPLKDNYPYMFSKKGEMIMWGRSISYRFGAVAPFPLMGLEKDATANFGWMRRIASGALLQFLKNPEFIKDNVPTLGFYGAFEPAVQRYSCRGSAFWLGKAFLGLIVPENNPFWNAVENEGAWANEIKKEVVFNKFQPGSEILITDYANIGASEIRAWSSAKRGTGDPVDFYRSNENYNRLAYNSAFPWQADSENGTVAMNYVFKNRDNKWEAANLYTFKSYDNGVYKRELVLESDESIQMSLADIPLINGFLRIDKNKSEVSVKVHLGHYSLPVLKGKIIRTSRKVDGHLVQIIDNGQYQLAMIILRGWGNSIKPVDAKGLHPMSLESTTINVEDAFVPGQDPFYCTLMLWKKSNQRWKSTELNPVKSIVISQDQMTVNLLFKDGSKKTVDF